MVARFNRMSRFHPVNSFKHVVDSSGALVAGTVSVTPIMSAGDSRNTGNPAVVAIGSKVSSLFLSIFVLGTTGGDSGLVDWYIWKNPRAQVSLGNTPTPGNTGISTNRNFIIHEEKGLAATQDGTPMVFKGVIKIPRHMQRVAEQDTINVQLVSDFAGTFCVKAIYKDYQ